MNDKKIEKPKVYGFYQAEDESQFQGLQGLKDLLVGIIPDLQEKIVLNPATRRMELLLPPDQLSNGKPPSTYLDHFFNNPYIISNTESLILLELTEHAASNTRHARDTAIKKAAKDATSEQYRNRLEQAVKDLPDAKVSVQETKAESPTGAQVIVVEDNHTNSSAKDWVMQHVGNITDGKKIHLIVEFGSEDTVDIKTLKDEIKFFYGGSWGHQNSKPYLAMIDKVLTLGGTVTGGESDLSMRIIHKQLVGYAGGSGQTRERLLYFDAAVTEQIAAIRKEKPDDIIIVFAGNNHRQGIVKNILATIPDTTVAVVTMDTPQSFYKFDALLKTSPADEKGKTKEKTATEPVSAPSTTQAAMLGRSMISVLQDSSTVETSANTSIPKDTRDGPP